MVFVDLRGRIPREPHPINIWEVKEMPNIKSAIKRVKVTEKKNLQNRMVKTGVKTAVKKYEAALTADPATAGAQLGKTASAIDKAVAKGAIHKNTANRKKSRLAKALARAAK